MKVLEFFHVNNRKTINSHMSKRKLEDAVVFFKEMKKQKEDAVAFKETEMTKQKATNVHESVRMHLNRPERFSEEEFKHAIWVIKELSLSEILSIKEQLKGIERVMPMVDSSNAIHTNLISVDGNKRDPTKPVDGDTDEPFRTTSRGGFTPWQCECPPHSNFTDRLQCRKCLGSRKRISAGAFFSKKSRGSIS